MWTFALWMCLAGNPNCPMWNSVRHIVEVFPAESRKECEKLWKQSETTPDPEGMVSRYQCKAVEETL